MRWTSWNQITSLAVLCAALMCARHASAASIAWVAFHGDAAVPTANAANNGFTEAPDKPYTDLLQSAGHTVTRFVTVDNFNTAPLNAFDVVIIGRGVNSGHYQDGTTETPVWNSLAVPTMIMSGYATRTNRLGLMSGNNIPDTAGSVRLTATNPAHPIFSGIVFDGANTMVNTFADLVTFTPGNPAAPGAPAAPVVQRGISVVTDPIVAGGQVLATIGTVGDPAFGGTTIAYFPAGTTMVNDGDDDVLGGNRLMFLSGSREMTIHGDGSGMYDLTPTGAHMFLNAVTFIAGTAIPEPSSALLFALSGLALGAFRKR